MPLRAITLERRQKARRDVLDAALPVVGACSEICVNDGLERELEAGVAERVRRRQRARRHDHASSLIRLLYIVCRAGSVGSLNAPGIAGGADDALEREVVAVGARASRRAATDAANAHSRR